MREIESQEEYGLLRADERQLLAQQFWKDFGGTAYSMYDEDVVEGVAEVATKTEDEWLDAIRQVVPKVFGELMRNRSDPAVGSHKMC